MHRRCSRQLVLACMAGTGGRRESWNTLIQAALAIATPEQIQQALAALAQAASASAGGQLKPEDLAALFGPQWATLVAMPGGLVALPPDQLQQLAAFEAPAAQAVQLPPTYQSPLLQSCHSCMSPPVQCLQHLAATLAKPQARTAGCCALYGDSASL